MLVFKEIEFWLEGEERRREGGRCSRGGEKGEMAGWGREFICRPVLFYKLSETFF